MKSVLKNITVLLISTIFSASVVFGGELTVSGTTENTETIVAILFAF
mgnify:CR=1 FL=1